MKKKLWENNGSYDNKSFDLTHIFADRFNFFNTPKEINQYLSYLRCFDSLEDTRNLFIDFYFSTDKNYNNIKFDDFIGYIKKNKLMESQDILLLTGVSFHLLDDKSIFYEELEKNLDIEDQRLTTILVCHQMQLKKHYQRLERIKHLMQFLNYYDSYKTLRYCIYYVALTLVEMGEFNLFYKIKERFMESQL